MAYAAADRRWVAQDALAGRDYLWKVYAWGGHRDAALMGRLELEKRLSDFLPAEPKPGWGYQRGKIPPRDQLRQLPSLQRFEPWGDLDRAWFEPAPKGVGRQPDERLYEGQRLLVSRGVKVGFGPRSRLVNRPLSFRHTIYCVPLPQLEAWQAKVIWATLLSSLGRYNFFMRSASWGLWHDSVLADDIALTPIRMPTRQDERSRTIVDAVDALQDDHSSSAVPSEAAVGALGKIDDAIFSLFETSDLERALVEDFHRYTLRFAGGGSERHGSERMPLPTSAYGSRSQTREIASESLRSYVSTFLDAWGRHLAPEGFALSWAVNASGSRDLIIVVFETYSGALPPKDLADPDWELALGKIENARVESIHAGVLDDQIIRIVTDTFIIVAKPNRPRLWSRSAAMEDAEATLLQAMNLGS